jgi:hypothetical protein
MSDRQTRVPNLFIVGAPKCGTSAFASGLGQHQNIFVGKKEPRYFDAPIFFDNPSDYPHRSLESYLELYSGDEAKRAKYRVDASVFNMYNPDGIQNILEISPEAKFIVILRDPVEAAKSMHSQRLKYTDKSMREVSDSFMECWALVEKRRKGKGFPEDCKNQNLFRYDFLFNYSPHIDALQSTIPQNQLLFIDYNVFRENSKHVYKKVFEFLGLRTIDVKLEIINPSFTVKQTLRNKSINFLRKSLVKLPFRPKNLVEFTKKLIDLFIEKENASKLDTHNRMEEVEHYFSSSKKAMDDVLGQYRINQREEYRADS